MEKEIFTLKIIITGYPDDLKIKMVEKYSGETSRTLQEGNPYFISKEIQLSKNQTVSLKLINILETPIIDFYRPDYYKGADGAVFTYQKDGPHELFEELRRFYEIFQNNPPYQTKFVVIGLRKDILKKESVPKFEGQALANEIGADFYDIREMNCDILNVIFSTLAQKIIDCKVES